MEYTNGNAPEGRLNLWGTFTIVKSYNEIWLWSEYIVLYYSMFIFYNSGLEYVQIEYEALHLLFIIVNVI